jgi:hypothetical protein
MQRCARAAETDADANRHRSEDAVIDDTSCTSTKKLRTMIWCLHGFLLRSIGERRHALFMNGPDRQEWLLRNFRSCLMQCVHGQCLLLISTPSGRMFQVLRNECLPSHVLPVSYYLAAYDGAILCPEGLTSLQTLGPIRIVVEFTAFQSWKHSRFPSRPWPFADDTTSGWR